MDKTINLRPVMTEKAYKLSETMHTYVFTVPRSTNKYVVAKAVAAQFQVTPLTVNVVNIKGKQKRTVRKGGRAINGRRSDYKKVYVTLKEGDSLPFFAAVKEDEQKAAKAAEKAAKGKK